MLAPAEQIRIYRDLPTTYTADWDGQTYEYTHEIWWENQDDDQMNYPRLVLGWNARGMPKKGWQPVNQVTDISITDAQDVQYEEGQRLYDELVCKCITNGRLNDDGVPPDIRAQEFAKRVTRYFRFEFDQNYDPANEDGIESWETDFAGARPVLARVVQPPVYAGNNVDDDVADAYQLTVRLHYTETDTTDVPSVEQVTGQSNVQDGDAWTFDT